MAQGAFATQVESLTGLTISSSGTSPTQSELTNFLVDGVRDVACRILAIKPEEGYSFSKTTDLTGSSGVEIQSGMVLDVVRADGVNAANLIPADPIISGHRYLAVDTDSLHFRSKKNPGWYQLNKTVFVVPVPSSGADAAKITHVHYDTGLLFSDSTDAIDNFPDKYQGLVVLYASCRSLMNALSAVLSNISDYTPPVITNAQDGNFGDDTDKDVTTLSGAAWTGLDYDFDGENMDFLKWFQVAGDMIQNQEDIELAKAQLDKINGYLTAYQHALANRGAVFDKAYTKYQADYQWISDRHTKLYNEYIGYFNILLGQKQQEQQAAQQSQQKRRGRK